MKYNILHLIDNVTKVNFGIWNAALANSGHLAKKGVRSFAVFPENEDFSYEDVNLLPIKSAKDVYSYIKQEQLFPSNTIVVSHGCWRWATRIGYKLSAKGFQWMAVPHGMLEPWSMKQKALKKNIYWKFFERRMLSRASGIRAVGEPEFHNLRRNFGSKVNLIPNGVEELYVSPRKKNGLIQFLFMARLHHKKGIIPLVKAWLSSSLAESKRHKLIIAGPDDGELHELDKLIQKTKNIEYIGAVYGEAKKEILENSHIYLLPSHSEGFPTSVLEAMSFGLIPLISKGCNFPEAFENKVALQMEPDKSQIKNNLEEVAALSFIKLQERGENARRFISENYTNEIISKKLDRLNRSLLE